MSPLASAVGVWAVLAPLVAAFLLWAIARKDTRAAERVDGAALCAPERGRA